MSDKDRTERHCSNPVFHHRVSRFKIDYYHCRILSAIRYLLIFSVVPILADILSSPPPGVYHEPISIRLGSLEPGIEIKYTLNNWRSTAALTTYSTPIDISHSTVIRAREYHNGTASDKIYTLFYVYIDTSLRSFESTLPLVVVDNFDAGRLPFKVENSGGEPPVEKQQAFMVLFEPGTSKTTRLQTPSITTNIGIKVRGSTSADFPKKSYAVESRDYSDADHNIAPLELPAEEDWILYGSRKFDQAFARNQLIFETYRQLGYWAPRWRFVELFLNTSGDNVSIDDYQGIYLLLEKIKRDDQRLDIDKMKPEHNALPEISGGYILKMDRLDPQPAEGFRTAHGIPTNHSSIMNYVEPPWADITEAQKTWIRNYLDEFEEALYAGNNDPTTGYPAYIDVRSFIDYMIFHDLSKDPDGMRLSTFMYKPRGGKLHMGPVWDFDRTMDSYDDRDDEADSEYSLRNHDWYRELFRDEWFFDQYKYRWQEVRQRHSLRTSFVDSLLDSWALEMADAIPREEDLWDYNLGIKKEIAHLKSWVQQRCEWLDSQYVADISGIFPAGGSDVFEHLHIQNTGKLLQIQSKGQNNLCRVSVFSLPGQPYFKTQKNGRDNVIIDTRAWPNGVYVLSVNTSRSQILKKIVITH